MWSAQQYLKQVPPRTSAKNILHRANMWRYNNLKPKGTLVNTLC